MGWARRSCRFAFGQLGLLEVAQGPWHQLVSDPGDPREAYPGDAWDLSAHSSSDVFVDLAAGDRAGDDLAELHRGFLGPGSVRVALFSARAQRRENDERGIWGGIRRISFGNRKDPAEVVIRSSRESATRPACPGGIVSPCSPVQACAAMSPRAA